MNFKNKGAKWLWDNCECINNQYVCFRQKLDVKSFKKAYISLCCDTTYELYVNGGEFYEHEYKSFWRHFSKKKDENKD